MEWNEGEYRSRRQKEMEKAREDMEQILRRHLGCDLRLISNFMFKYQHLTNSQDINKYRRIKAAIFRIREDLHESYYWFINISIMVMGNTNLDQKNLLLRG